MFRKFILVLVTLLTLSLVATGQVTAFTFQGKLGDSGTPVNGTFDMQFKSVTTVTITVNRTGDTSMPRWSKLSSLQLNTGRDLDRDSSLPPGATNPAHEIFETWIPLKLSNDGSPRDG